MTTGDRAVAAVMIRRLLLYLFDNRASDFVGEGHFMRILSDMNAPDDAKTRRVVLCSGKVAYDLMEARDAAGDAGGRRSAGRSGLARR